MTKQQKELFDWANELKNPKSYYALAELAMRLNEFINEWVIAQGWSHLQYKYDKLFKEIISGKLSKTEAKPLHKWIQWTLKNKDNYKPTYLNVVQFTDEDVLLIKNSLERQKKFKNKSHNELILELSKKSAEKLQLSKEPKNKLNFLKA